jgi:hypothetical protein
MNKLKEIWKDWRGTVGFVGGALVVSTTYFTCSVEPNLEQPTQETVEESVEEEIPVEEEPKSTETE